MIVGFISALGRRAIRSVRAIGRAGFMLFGALIGKPQLRKHFPLFVKQLHVLGVQSLLIIMLSGLFIGMVLGLQGYVVLVDFAAETSLGQLVALSLLRELGPVVTALLFAGRAGSALTAQSKRLNVAASNLANADSVTGPDGQPYRAKQVVFQVDAAPGAATGGVKVADVVESQAPDKLVYEPGNPLADASGYVKMPNVDVVGEMVNSMSASRSYQANVEVLNTVKSMMLKTLTLGQ